MIHTREDYEARVAEITGGRAYVSAPGADQPCWNDGLKLVHERSEYIRAPMEPQNTSGVSIIATTKILVTDKTPKLQPWRKDLRQRPTLWYGSEVRDGSDLGLGCAGAETIADNYPGSGARRRL